MSDSDNTDETTDPNRVDFTTGASARRRRNGEYSPPTDAPGSDTARNRSGGAQRGSVPAVAPPNVRRGGSRGPHTRTRAEAHDTAWEEQFRRSGAESITHVWGKLALDRRRTAQAHPWFRGTYEFERTVSDWVADCLITDTTPPAWIEFVVAANQQYRAKTRAALRFGYPIYWVFLDGADAARQTAREALAPHLEDGVTFGVFNPQEDRLALGDAVTFENYRVPVDAPAAFRRSEVLGYRAGAAHVPLTTVGYDFGWIRVGTEPYRVYARLGTDEKQVKLVSPGGPAGIDELTSLSPGESWFPRRIAAGDVERIGPIPSTSTYERRRHRQLPSVEE